MANGHGGARPGSGRKKGSANKNNAKTRDELWAYVTAHNKTNPLTFMLDCVDNKELEISLRIQCAKEVASYMAQKLRQIELEVGPQTLRVIEKRYGPRRTTNGAGHTITAKV